MRILHAPHSVAGNAWCLSRAERDLGHASDTMVFGSSPFGYGADIDLSLPGRTRRGAIGRTLGFFMDACARYDVFHFNFGASLFFFFPRAEFGDLPFLRALGKKIIMTFQGCDARDKYYCLERYETSACRECDHEPCNEALNARKRTMIRKVSRHAHRLYVLNPDLLQAVPGSRYLPYASVDPRQWTPAPWKPPAPPFKILHAPTSRAIKGTSHVIEAVERLKKRGAPVELLLVENIPHRDIQALYKQAHLAVDQLLVGWYGAFAVEAMALGLPTLCYLREEDLAGIPFREKIPLVKTTKETLEEDIMRLIDDAPRRVELGKRGRAYVEEFHDPLAIARGLVEDYTSL